LLVRVRASVDQNVHIFGRDVKRQLGIVLDVKFDGQRVWDICGHLWESFKGIIAILLEMMSS
jgi:hypothetical protein